MFDFHMHSIISFDGHDRPETMVKAAEERGLKEICFTEHADYQKDKLVQDMVFDVQLYNTLLDPLHSDKVKIRRGIEFGLYPYNQEQMKADISKRKYDFVIGSIHFVDEIDVYFPEYWKGKTIAQAEQRFLEQTLACVQAHDGFDVVGHLTYLSKSSAHPANRPIDFEAYQELTDEILRTLVSKGIGMEVNTSGMRRIHRFLPDEPYLRRFHELGGEIVTVGSDAHTHDRVGQHTKEACDLLREIFGYVCTFEDRKPIFHKL